MRHLVTGLTATCAVAAAALAPVVIAPAAQGAAPAAASPSARAALLAAARTDSARTASALKLGSGERLVVKDVVRDADGSEHVRYDRTFDGLRVIGGDLVAHQDRAGAVSGVSWNATGKVAVASTTPTVSAAAALGKAATQGLRSAAAPQGELVVYAEGAKPVLAYDVVTEGVRADQTPSRLHTIVDAHSGRTLTSWDDIEQGTGKGIFVGTVTLGTTLSGSTYQMKDSRGNTATDLKGATSGTGTLFTDADDVWGNGSYTDRASAAVDAFYGAQKTYDFYNTVLGRAGVFNTGKGVPSRVHYGNNYVNAFWDGQQMTYGDGSGNTHPLVELDVAGHEMSHGVTENTAGLQYTGDAGGLNEATSDIFGTAVEWYANNPNDVPDYLIGELININGNGTPLRYMDQPSKDGASKDCWSSSLGGLDPHYSSGPLNHWFYLASEGSGAKTINGVSYNSPTCNGSSVTPVGRDKAEKIWYRALSTYLTSTSNYAAARNAAIKAAKDLYPTDTTTCANIAASFSAIAVPAGTETCGTTGGGGGGTGTNLLANPGFESGAVSWTGSTGPITNDTGRPAHTGTWKLWLGGNGTTTTESEQQTVTVPSTGTPTLSFWIRTDTAESGTTAYDTMKVQVVSGTTTTTLATFSNASANSTYTQRSYSLASFAGKSVTVKFLMNEDSSLQTSFVVDDTSVAS
ncbi:M4 family metallopeptidase [Lapillicoccus jejuensis]|uniref:Neutral metalloproteinase n=1 Tax=Lapillicoccus jejuensis TaxID=402171 RepID=A0A542DY18_9MICO|nr:M4 family metallopeptidase [Lapillicoccus jejuensis]TQJ07992.1 Zn-dependent metalloprotease [Lapillicoccus jejuensis]